MRRALAMGRARASEESGAEQPSRGASPRPIAIKRFEANCTAVAGRGVENIVLCAHMQPGLFSAAIQRSNFDLGRGLVWGKLLPEQWLMS